MRAGVLMLVLALALPARAAIEVSDDEGTPVRLAQPAQRIVSLAPHLTELLFAAGAGARVVGVDSASDHPPQAATIARVGSFEGPDIEAIVRLRPDLVVAWASGGPRAPIERLRALGLTVFVSEPGRIDDVAASIERFGALAGTPRAAQSAAAQLRARHARLRERYARRPAVTVFYEIWPQPLMTVGGPHLISDVMRLCGGQNVFVQISALAPAVNVEAVLAADPQAIVASGMADERPEWLDAWRRWPQMTAVRADNLFFVPPDLLQRHTPRLLDGAQRLCEQLEQARARLGLR